MTGRWIFAVAVSAALMPSLAIGQVSSRGLVSMEAARHVGLERMWFTQIAMDRARGRAAGIHQHVSATQAHTVYEINFSGRRYVFSERERNAFGELIGVDGARQKADEKLAQIKADLESAGKKDVPLPAISTYIVPEITLYATSERGLVHAIDAETGKTRWSASVGSPIHPTTMAAANDTHVSVLNGSTLYVLLATDGSTVWTKSVGGAPGAAPAMSDGFIFVPMINGAVETYSVDNPKRPVTTHRSFGRTMVQPVVSMNSVAWPTSTGNLYVGFADGSGMRYRIQATDAINSAPAFLAPDKVFATSLDGYIYCLSEQRPSILWRFTTGEPISHSPVALVDTLYAITDRGNMYALGAEDGQERWVVGGIRSYLAGNEDRLYVKDLAGNLLILDAKSGSRLGSLGTSGLDLTTMNVQTDRIFLGTTTGLIQCFREMGKPFPVVHMMHEPKKPAAQPALKPPGGAAPMPMPPGADPFAVPGPAAPVPAPAGADPFAAPPAAPPMPMPPPPAAADPFAP